MSLSCLNDCGPVNGGRLLDGSFSSEVRRVSLNSLTAEIHISKRKAFEEITFVPSVWHSLACVCVCA